MRVKIVLLSISVFLCACAQATSTAVSQPSLSTAHQEQPAALSIADTTPITASQTRYYIDPNRSLAQYSVNEVLLSSFEGRHIVGTVAADFGGEILIDWETPANSRVGEIQINVQELQSDSKLRDKRLRTAYLESDTFPIAAFVADHSAVEFPKTLSSGAEVRFTLPGNLGIRDVVQRVEWEVALTAHADEIVGSAFTEIQMSDFDLGPIKLIGLLETDNTMQLSLDFVATTTPADLIDNPLLQEAAAVASVSSAPDFFNDVAPILEANCVACHSPGQIGHSIYALETVADAVAVADDLAFVVETGYMPPWPVSDKTPAILHERKLDNAEIQTIVDWARAGGKIDGSLETPLTATVLQSDSIRSDVVMRLPAPYTPHTTVNDVYRCYMFDPQLTEARYMTGFQVIPTNLAVAHHLTSEILPRSTALADVQRLEAHDSEPGWTCPNNTSGVAAGSFGDGMELSNRPAWTPGTYAQLFPGGYGVRLAKDSVFIIQMHYNTSGGTGPDQTELHLQLAPLDASIRPMAGYDMYAPVEIPCPAGLETPQCARESIVGTPNSDPTLAKSLLGRCGRTLDDYRSQPADNVRSDCLYEIDIDGEIVIASAHMHELGKGFNLTLNPDTPQAQTILDIDHWDFAWQGTYSFATPIPVKAGDRVKLTCVWDNSPVVSEAANASNLDSPFARRLAQGVALLTGVRPVFAHDEIDERAYRYVSWGYGTGDEMCIGSLSFVPAVGTLNIETPMHVVTPPRIGRLIILFAIVLGMVATVAYFSWRKRTV